MKPAGAAGVSTRERLLFIALGLVGAFFITRGLVAAPGYTDVFYHFNAANRLVTGQGLNDAYLWTYIGAPDSLPAPSHLYWMPMTSLLAALGMGLLNAPGDYTAAQWPFALLFAGTVYIGFWLGERLGGTRRHAWFAGLLTLFSGYFTRFWGAIDTFTPYAFFGALCLVFLGLTVNPSLDESKVTRRPLLYAALAGVAAGLSHLTRADGLLFLLVGWLVIVWPGKPFWASFTRRLPALFALTLAYLLVMLPWFIRNQDAIGSPMPLGGTQSIWFAEYNDLFNYPPDATPAAFFADGLGTLFASRWEAFSQNLATFVVVEGLIVMTPLMLLGLWRRRREPFLRGFWLYALGLHLAMTFVFPYPGYRGGLLHSAAALVPWWAVLGVVGLDDAVDWIARRRRTWNPRSARWIFAIALLGVALFLSLSIGLRNRVSSSAMPRDYQELLEKVPSEARVMMNDPAQLYYFTGLGGVVLPNEAPEVIQEIARRYDVDYLLLQEVTPDGLAAYSAPSSLWPILTGPPEFLTPIPMDDPTVRLYAIHH